MLRILKWIGLAAIVVFAGLLMARMLFSEKLGEAAFQRAVTQALSDNPMTDFEDGLHVVLIGTGSPLPDPARAGPSTAVIAGGKIYIVDSGGGSVRRMGEMRLPAGRIEATFLTHFHSDHIDGLGELMMMRWTSGGRTAPMPVYGPEGVEQIVDGLNMMYAQDKVYRVAHHSEAVVPPSGQGGTAMPFDAPDTGASMVVYEADGLVVTAFSVDHDPIEPAVGYRFDYQGRSVTLSGDTEKDVIVAAAGKDTDLLIHEALNREMVRTLETTMRENGQERTAKILFDIQDYHTSPVEAAEIAEAAGAGALVLSHIVPAAPARALYPYYLKGTSDAYSGPVIMGEDGMVFSLPADSDTLVRKRLR